MSVTAQESRLDAAWSLLLPPGRRLVCLKSNDTKLVEQLKRMGSRVEILESQRQPEAGATYDLALLWEPRTLAELRQWLAQLDVLPEPPAQIAVWCRNRWLRPEGFESAPRWGAVSRQMVAMGYHQQWRYLGLPAARRVRQIVPWENYGQTRLVTHQRSHRAWKGWLRQRNWYRWLQPICFQTFVRDPSKVRPDVVQLALRRISNDFEAECVIDNMLISPNGTAIFMTNMTSASSGQSERGVLKLPFDGAIESRLCTNEEALRWLEVHHSELGSYKHAFPKIMTRGRVGNHVFSLEERADGKTAQEWDEKQQVLAIEHLSGFLETLMDMAPDRPVSAARNVLRIHGIDIERCCRLLPSDAAQRLQRLWNATLEQLGDAEVRLVPRHGDFKLENVIGPPGNLNELKILDWELFLESGLPHLDALHLVLSRKRRIAGVSIGRSIRRWLLPEEFDDFERGMLARLSRGLDPAYLSAVPFLYWLDRIAPISVRGAWPSEAWAQENVIRVIEDMESSTLEVHA